MNISKPEPVKQKRVYAELTYLEFYVFVSFTSIEVYAQCRKALTRAYNAALERVTITELKSFDLPDKSDVSNAELLRLVQRNCYTKSSDFIQYFETKKQEWDTKRRCKYYQN